MNRRIALIGAISGLLMISVAIYGFWQTNRKNGKDEPVFRVSEIVTTVLSRQTGQVIDARRDFYGEYVYAIKFYTPNILHDEKYSIEKFRGYEIVKANN